MIYVCPKCKTKAEGPGYCYCQSHLTWMERTDRGPGPETDEAPEHRCRCDFTDGPKDTACACCGAPSYEPCRHGDNLLALRDALAREKNRKAPDRERVERAVQALIDSATYPYPQWRESVGLARDALLALIFPEAKP